ncbi:S1C family serine protease [Pseudoalteromonas sp. G4]|uniref:S1C family serine protease n=1 Tax=Pseudoalteromonas sp. G4 TaxID=2992761 RepID=UPI00237E0EB4|nr:trypsin-like peptidase domain-containing protein [Pseudoalteromonas sp. G4]MDE3271018.1 trypsin-like peptidase domain-containing protein [Pseudoalteromonas sp. G4]
MLKNLIITFLFIPLSLVAKDYSSLYNKLDKSVVIIHSDTQEVRAEANQLVTKTASSLGTGTLINKEGLILTAAHVVNSADELTVNVKNRGEYKAKVIASFQAADIALIKLITNDKNFPFVKLGDSNKAEIGNEVFVIGTPYGLEHTLTVGHLSGRRIHKHPSFNEIEFIQTDAAINQGNSGGPLFLASGELIGVVSYIQSQSGGNEGLGFAASTAMVKNILIDQPMIWFGIEYSFLTPVMAAALNVPQRAGLLIEKVATQSFAEKLGLKGGVIPAVIDEKPVILGGDVILAVGPHILTGEEQNYLNILQYTKSLKGGEKIKFKVLRMGHELELEAELPDVKIKLL